MASVPSPEDQPQVPADDLGARARSLRRLGYNWRAVGWMLGGIPGVRAQALAEGAAPEPAAEQPVFQMALVVPAAPEPPEKDPHVAESAAAPVLVTPTGYRVEGLDLASLALLLEHLG